MKDGEFHHCHHQIFHSATTHIFQSLKPAMTEPEVVWCPSVMPYTVLVPTLVTTQSSASCPVLSKDGV